MITLLHANRIAVSRRAAAGDSFALGIAEQLGPSVENGYLAFQCVLIYSALQLSTGDCMCLRNDEEE